MVPSVDGIDHIHINVTDRARAERWYKEILGLSRIQELEFWAGGGGPLTLADASGRVHLALFESNKIQNTTIALKVSSQGLAAWIDHLARHGIDVQPIDHDVSWSIYFKDVDGNPFEITTYEYSRFKAKSL